jgi:hypothetical protein
MSPRWHPWSSEGVPGRRQADLAGCDARASRKRHIPDILSRAAEDMLADLTWHNVAGEAGPMARRRCAAEHPFGTIKRMTTGRAFPHQEPQRHPNRDAPLDALLQHAPGSTSRPPSPGSKRGPGQTGASNRFHSLQRRGLSAPENVSSVTGGARSPKAVVDAQIQHIASYLIRSLIAETQCRRILSRAWFAVCRQGS